jgi:hypothetical protein
MGRRILAVCFVFAIVLFMVAVARCNWPVTQKPFLKLGWLLAVLVFVLEWRISVIPRKECLPAWACECLGWQLIALGGLAFAAETACGRYVFTLPIFGIGFVFWRFQFLCFGHYERVVRPPEKLMKWFEMYPQTVAAKPPMEIIMDLSVGKSDKGRWKSRSKRKIASSIAHATDYEFSVMSTEQKTMAPVFFYRITLSSNAG